MRRATRIVAMGSFWLAAGLALSLACGRSEAGAQIYEGHGIVRDVQPDYGQVVIEHEDIPGLMPAMTMNFDVADRRLLDELAPGQAIAFELAYDGRSYRIVSARVLAGGASGDRGPGSLAALADLRDPAPPFVLTDQDGRRVALADLAGRALLVDFVYTRCPGPCPILTGLLAEVQRRLPPAWRDRVQLVSISLDPAHDTPERLREYARARGADLAGWSFLTGAAEEVADVVARYGVGSIRQPDGDIEHTVVVFLVDPQGRIAKRYLGLDHDPETWLRDLAAVLGEPAPEVGAGASQEPRRR